MSEPAPAPGRPAPTRRCYLHIGLQKTGTSYLQKVFWQSQDALDHQGLTMVPGSKLDTFRVMLSVRDRLRPDVDPPVAFQALDRLRDAVVSAATPRLLLTEESLAPASVDQARRLVEHLPDVELHLVVTVRDLARQIPSMWQQKLSARRPDSFDEYLDDAVSRGPRSKVFWANQDLPAVLARWGTVVPPERTHLVTVPPPGSGPGELLARYCSVLGVDPTTLDTDVERSNESLGLPQAELLRRVNAALGDRLTARAAYRDSGKFYFAKQVLADQRGQRALVPARLEDWVRDTAAQHVAAVKDGGYDVVGDLADLDPPVQAFTEDPQSVSDGDVADVAARAIAAMLVDHHAGVVERRRLRRRLERAQQRSPAAGPGTTARDGWAARVRRRVRRLGRR